MKHKILPVRLLVAFIAVLGLCFGVNSCRNSELVDNTEFNIFYAGITDIGPSMSCDLPIGSYIGPAPSDFKIYRVTFNGETFDNADGVFSIDEENGTVSIKTGNSLEVGKYALSISCKAGNKTYDFPDIITVNMMKPVPEEIKVEPAEITVKHKDILDGYFVSENNTAQVYSDSEAISINSYEISEVTLDGESVSAGSLFKISNTGLISMTPDEETKPGMYRLTLKLNTLLTGEDPEEGLFVDALTVNITSAPVDLIYPFNPIKAEANGIGRVSETPKVVGSQTDLSFKLDAVSPSEGADYITVDEKTGAVTIAENHPFQAGNRFSLDITVTNDNGTTSFANACRVEILEKIDEVKGLSYPAQTIVRGAGFNVDRTLEAGDEVVYSFEELPAELSALTINSATGRISLAKGNAIVEGDYKVNVIAQNYKGAVTAEFALTVQENPLFFTTASWGTNLVGENDALYKACENQFRYPILLKQADIPAIGLVSSDIKDMSKVTFAIKKLSGADAPDAVIDEKTGTIQFTRTRDYTTNKDGKKQDPAIIVDLYMVTVTNGAGENGETVREIPVFLHSCDKEGKQTLQFTPMVCKINPRTGGTTHGVEYIGFTEDEKAALMLDYRRNFNYYNYNGPKDLHKNGAPGGADTFMKYMWDFYWFNTIQSTAPTYNAKPPMSYYANCGTNQEGKGIRPKTLAMPLGYVNPAKGHGVTINPRKFTYGGAWADGFLIGQMTWSLEDPAKNEKDNEDALNKGKQVTPLVIWFDPNYEN